MCRQSDSLCVRDSQGRPSELHVHDLAPVWEALADAAGEGRFVRRQRRRRGWRRRQKGGGGEVVDSVRREASAATWGRGLCIDVVDPHPGAIIGNAAAVPVVRRELARRRPPPPRCRGKLGCPSAGGRGRSAWAPPPHWRRARASSARALSELQQRGASASRVTSRQSISPWRVTRRVLRPRSEQQAHQKRNPSLWTERRPALPRLSACPPDPSCC